MERTGLNGVSGYGVVRVGMNEQLQVPLIECRRRQLGYLHHMCQDFVFPRICRLLYARLASLHYIIQVVLKC